MLIFLKYLQKETFNIKLFSLRRTDKAGFILFIYINNKTLILSIY